MYIFVLKLFLFDLVASCLALHHGLERHHGLGERCRRGRRCISDQLARVTAEAHGLQSRRRRTRLNAGWADELSYDTVGRAGTGHD
jgi:hypothetical protein